MNIPSSFRAPAIALAFCFALQPLFAASSAQRFVEPDGQQKKVEQRGMQVDKAKPATPQAEEVKNAQAQAQASSGDKPMLVTQANHSEAITSLAYSPDGRLVASTGDDGFIKLWDAATG